MKFHVPVPPLVLDKDLVSDPNGAAGFEFSDDGSTATINDVQVSGADTVTITLSGAPTGGNRHLRYALRATPDTCPGPKTGPRGNLRDSDKSVSQTKVDLSNWSVSFDLPIE